MAKENTTQVINGNLKNKTIMKTYLIYDTETNGFPPHARMTQLAWCLFSEDGTIINAQQHFIKPNGWTIPKTEFFLNNGMTTERNEELGIPLNDALQDFLLDLSKANYKIAHNHSFDVQIVTNEIIKAGESIALFNSKPHFCTMLSTVNFVGALNKWGKPGKWPNLQELHVKCFGEEFDGAHDALADVKATMRCFLHLKEKNLVQI